MQPEQIQHAGLVIALPDGGSMGGVTSWARVTADAWRSIGGACEIVAISSSTDPIGAMTHAMRTSAEALLGGGARRMVLLPQLSGACYAAACAAADGLGQGSVGIVGWMHTDIRHDIELVRRFMPAMERVVCVSESARSALLNDDACHERDAIVVRTGVHAPGSLMVTSPSWPGLRLMYAGRLDAFQKRVCCLPIALAAIRAAGIDAHLTVVGDGPARHELERIVQQHKLSPHITLRGKLGHDDLDACYAEHDALLLASRSEGLGLARIEAAMLGCVPIVTPGGASEGIEPGVSGLVVEIPEDAGDARAGELIAAAVIERGVEGLRAMRPAASAHARDGFGFDRYACDLGRVLGLGAGAERRSIAEGVWSRTAADPASWASFTVPNDAASRVRSVCEPWRGRRVVLHGAGAHSAAIWGAIQESGVDVVAVADDDPQRWGGEFEGVPIVDPSTVPEIDAACVILSSWLHEGAVWARREMYTRAGLPVVRIYGGERAAVTS